MMRLSIQGGGAVRSLHGNGLVDAVRRVAGFTVQHDLAIHREGGSDMSKAFEKNTAYIYEDVSYLCIGFTENTEKAVLAPFWADDEDASPAIQNDAYIVVGNQINEQFIELQQFRGKVVFE